MLKLLIKKQLMEVFRMYFYDAKKNKARSKSGIIAFFVFYVLIMVGVLGGMFTFLSVSLCAALNDAGMDWLYFMLLSGIAILLGAFGSVFNTYAGLYLSKDNDLLLSMPIPVKYIVASRLVNVYLLGAMYSATVIIPAVVVYLILTEFSAAKLICGIILILLVTVIVFLLSCLLGWCVAKLSMKLKNKSFVVVATSLILIGLYYFVYFKAQQYIADLIENAAVYGERIKGAAYGLYLFGRIGCGDFLATLIFVLATAVLTVLVWTVLKKTFMSIATASGKTEKIVYREKTAKQRTAFGAMLAKEFKRFTSSPTYMLNCGLGIVFIPALGVLLLIKGPEIIDVLNSVFGEQMECTCVLLCTAMITLSSMIDIAAPSVSLEGKSIWIYQSLPVRSRDVLRAKTMVHLILAGVPYIFTLICGMIILDCSIGMRLLICILSIAVLILSTLLSAFLGIQMPNLTWTNEVMPIKQGGAVAISIFGGWGIAAAFTVPFFLIGYRIGTTAYLAIWTAVFIIASVILALWIDTKGAKKFEEL